MEGSLKDRTFLGMKTTYYGPLMEYIGVPSRKIGIDEWCPTDSDRSPQVSLLRHSPRVGYLSSYSATQERTCGTWCYFTV